MLGQLGGYSAGCSRFGQRRSRSKGSGGSGVGGISESDVTMATTYEAAIFGFNVRADSGAWALLEKDGIEVRYYGVIYEILDDLVALSGMLAPEIREEIIGIAEVRDVFNSPRYGQVAGCMVTEGSVLRSKPIRVLRDNIVIYEGELESLRRFKDDVNEVRNGTECGIGVRNYNDVKSGDLIEVYDSKEVAGTTVALKYVSCRKNRGFVQRRDSYIIQKKLRDPRLAKITSLMK